MAGKVIVLRWARWAGRAAVAAGFAVGVVLLLLWQAGKFSPKVPAVAPEDTSPRPQLAGQVVSAELKKVPQVETAVGTVRAVHTTSLGAKLLARALEVNLKAGQGVREGDVLVRFDDSDIRAKLRQASAAVSAAEAVRNQAAADEERYAVLAQRKAVSQQEYERTVTARRAAEAELRRAQESVNEIQAMLDWATVRAPMDGIVVDKKIDVGDMVTPGQTLATIYDPRRMELVASVRESLARRLKVGEELEVFIEGLNKQCSGTVREIVPEAQAASRTFQVKVTGPCPPGIYTGMFGRLLIPLQEEQVLVIPRRAVRQVGQLDLVEVVAEDKVQRRAVRIGRTLDGHVEVLSGLREGEKVAVPEESAAQGDRSDLPQSGPKGASHKSDLSPSTRRAAGQEADHG